jgi:GntR family transcriptional repressor for pyruvate dehydrogenase complex
VPRHQGLSERVAQILKRFILAEPLEAGERLPAERRLADALNVSRTVVREALSQLIGEGIVVRRSPRAIAVAEFDRGRLAADLALVDAEVAEMRHLIELRVIIEIGAIEAIVERATGEQLREIERSVVEGERRLAAEEPIVLADVRFHAALPGTLGNDAINSLLPLIEEHLRQNFLADAHQLSGTGTPDDHRVVAQHRQIFEAIKRRDVEAARLVMLAHLNPYLRRNGTASATDAVKDVESRDQVRRQVATADRESPVGGQRRREMG